MSLKDPALVWLLLLFSLPGCPVLCQVLDLQLVNLAFQCCTSQARNYLEENKQESILSSSNCGSYILMSRQFVNVEFFLEAPTHLYENHLHRVQILMVASLKFLQSLDLLKDDPLTY